MMPVFAALTVLFAMANSGLPGTSRYVTQKNRKNSPDRLELKKYNPILQESMRLAVTDDFIKLIISNHDDVKFELTSAVEKQTA